MRQQFFRSVARLLGIAALALAVALTQQSALAQGTTTIAVSPSNTNTQVGQTVAVDIIVTDYSNLYGADITVNFDRTRLQALDDNPFNPGVNVTLGPLLTSGAGGYFNLINTADNSTGVVRLSLSQLKPSAPVSCTAPCSGVLITIHFLALATGVAPVTLPNAPTTKLSDPNSFAIPATLVGGTVTIGTPTAAVVTALRASLDNGQARLTWETGSESSLLGFNVWASENAATGYVQRNTALIAAKSPGELKGNGYEFQEAASKNSFYKLEIVRADNSSEWMGPVQVDNAAACASKPATAALLAPANKATVTPLVTLDWADAVCAHRYRVQVRRDGASGAVAENARVNVSTYTTTLERAGTYYWRVRTLGEKRRSAWSEWRAFMIR